MGQLKFKLILREWEFLLSQRVISLFQRYFYYFKETSCQLRRDFRLNENFRPGMFKWKISSVRWKFQAKMLVIFSSEKLNRIRKTIRALRCTCSRRLACDITWIRAFSKTVPNFCSSQLVKETPNVTNNIGMYLF